MSPCYPSRNFQPLKVLAPLTKAPASWPEMRKMMRNDALMRLKPIWHLDLWAWMNASPISAASPTKARKVNRLQGVFGQDLELAEEWQRIG